MAVFTQNDAKVMLPRNIAAGMIEQTLSTSTVAKLSHQEPMRFGETDYITFNEAPRMEYIEPGAEKSSTSASYGVVTAKPHKGQVTLRFDEEVQWADEDYQLGLLTQLASAGQVALSRGLDLGLYHAINPLSGTKIATWDNYVDNGNSVVVQGVADNATPDAAHEADALIRAAVGMLTNRDKPAAVSGIAMDPKFAWALSALAMHDGQGNYMGQRYPALGFGTSVTDFMGLNVAQGNTVSGVPEAADTKCRAIVGDFTGGIRWGIQKELPVELIRYGDPDGQGDLKRRNQIALRLEIVYGWYVFEDRFAIVKAA